MAFEQSRSLDCRMQTILGLVDFPNRFKSPENGAILCRSSRGKNTAYTIGKVTMDFRSGNFDKSMSPEKVSPKPSPVEAAT